MLAKDIKNFEYQRNIYNRQCYAKFYERIFFLPK